jgi:uncharacterized protein (TIGR02391 family)
MSEEIDNLILMVLRLREKGYVNVNTTGVSELSDALTVFSTKYSCVEEMRILKSEHLPYKYGLKMADEDVSAIIRFLLKKRQQYKENLLAAKFIIHPAILSVTVSKMQSGHYADAVESAFKELNKAVKVRVKSKLDKELDGVSLMQRVFSVENPLLLIEGNIDTQSKKDAQKGYMMMFVGAMSAIRNPIAHENVEISEEEAIRSLMLASMLMFKLDASHLVEDGQ